jgi:hypothetical protein
MTDIEAKTAAVLAAITCGSLSLDRVRELHATGRERMKDPKEKRRLTAAQILKIKAYGLAACQFSGSTSRKGRERDDSNGQQRRIRRNMKRPKIVCLCGSIRFYQKFQEANYRETLKGNIVLTVGFYPHAQDKTHGGDKRVTPEQKIALDELHKRKIDLADEVFVINVAGYIGESTRSEIEYAQAHGKPIRYLESVE